MHSLFLLISSPLHLLSHRHNVIILTLLQLLALLLELLLNEVLLSLKYPIPVTSELRLAILLLHPQLETADLESESHHLFLARVESSLQLSGLGIFLSQLGLELSKVGLGM